MQTFETILAEWEATKKTAQQAAEREKELRALLCAAAFPTAKIGVNKVLLADGRTFKATYKINYSIDRAALSAAIVEARERGLDIEAALRVKHELVPSRYAELGTEERGLIDPALTTRTGLPSIEVS